MEIFNYFQYFQYYHWIIFGVLILLFELFLLGTQIIIFWGFGSILVGFINYFFTLELRDNLILVCVFSILFTFLFKKAFRKKEENKQENINRNLIGETGEVVEVLSSNSARVKIGDTTWKAEFLEEKPILKSSIIVVDMDGIVLKVREKIEPDFDDPRNNN